MPSELNIASKFPLISCVMPTTCQSSYVSESVSCFLKQDYKNKELIILNDGPGEICADDLPGVRIVNVPKRFQTLGEKRNTAIEMAQGEIIAIWDDDGISFPWRLSWSWEEMQRYETPFYHPAECWARCGGTSICDKCSVPGCFSHGQVAFTKELWEKAGKYPAQRKDEKAALISEFFKLLSTDFLTHPIPRSERFYVIRDPSQINVTSNREGHGSHDGGAFETPVERDRT